MGLVYMTTSHSDISYTVELKIKPAKPNENL